MIRALRPGSRLHFVGLGGIGMSGLAQMCAAAGYAVSGSDRGYGKPENRRIFDKLELQHIAIYPQDGSFASAGGADYLIYSTAIEADNPDFLAAGTAEKVHRSEALAAMIRAFPGRSIAVTGSCGKSTVTGYLAETLLNLGEDPDCLNGALVNRFAWGRYAGNYRQGNGKYLVFEADESDKSLLNYAPDYALLLNCGTDHYEKEELLRVFTEFLAKVKVLAVVERELYRALKDRLPASGPAVVVFESEIGARGDYAVKRYRKVTRTDAVYVRGRRARLAPSGDRALAGEAEAALELYGVRNEQNRIETTARAAEFADGGRVILPQPGRHMAVNALAVDALLQELGFAPAAVLEALERFDGIWRRFDYAGTTVSGARVYDDYAHNPEKIAAAIAGAQELGGGRIFAVFQPHGYGPLGFMREALYEQVSGVLRRGDAFLMLEPYYAGGSSSFSPTSAEVVAGYRAGSRRRHFHYFPDRGTLTDYLLLSSRPGDIILIMGARDNSLSDYAKSLAADA